MHLLEQQRLAVGQPEALEVERRRPELETKARRDRFAGRLRPGGDHPGLRIEAAGLHLLGEREVAGEVPIDPGVEDERSAPAGTFHPPLAHELSECPPDRDEAAAIAGGQVALGRQAIPRPPLAGVQGALQVEVDLMVQRDRAELESETGHRRVWTSGGIDHSGSCARDDC